MAIATAIAAVGLGLGVAGAVDAKKQQKKAAKTQAQMSVQEKKINKIQQTAAEYRLETQKIQYKQAQNNEANSKSRLQTFKNDAKSAKDQVTQAKNNAGIAQINVKQSQIAESKGAERINEAINARRTVQLNRQANTAENQGADQIRALEMQQLGLNQAQMNLEALRANRQAIREGQVQRSLIASSGINRGITGGSSGGATGAVKAAALEAQNKIFQDRAARNAVFANQMGQLQVNDATKDKLAMLSESQGLVNLSNVESQMRDAQLNAQSLSLGTDQTRLQAANAVNNVGIANRNANNAAIAATMAGRDATNMAFNTEIASYETKIAENNVLQVKEGGYLQTMSNTLQSQNQAAANGKDMLGAGVNLLNNASSMGNTLSSLGTSVSSFFGPTGVIP